MTFILIFKESIKIKILINIKAIEYIYINREFINKYDLIKKSLTKFINLKIFNNEIIIKNII